LAEAIVPIGNDAELESEGVEGLKCRENVVENAPGVGLREAIV
jgi:hypothetical protein